MDVAIRALHLLAAAVWAGGLVMLALLAASTRETLSEADRSELFRVVGRRFLVLWAVAAVVLALTGLELVDRHFGGLSALGDADGGGLVIAKSAIFAALLALAGVHGLVLGPRLRELKRRARRGEDVGERVRRAGAAQGAVSGLLLLGTLAAFVLAADLAG